MAMFDSPKIQPLSNKPLKLGVAESGTKARVNCADTGSGRDPPSGQSGSDNKSTRTPVSKSSDECTRFYQDPYRRENCGTNYTGNYYNSRSHKFYGSYYSRSPNRSNNWPRDIDKDGSSSRFRQNSSSNSWHNNHIYSRQAKNYNHSKNNYSRRDYNAKFDFKQNNSKAEEERSNPRNNHQGKASSTRSKEVTEKHSTKSEGGNFAKETSPSKAGESKADTYNSTDNATQHPKKSSPLAESDRSKKIASVENSTAANNTTPANRESKLKPTPRVASNSAKRNYTKIHFKQNWDTLANTNHCSRATTSPEKETSLPNDLNISKVIADENSQSGHKIHNSEERFGSEATNSEVKSIDTIRTEDTSCNKIAAGSVDDTVYQLLTPTHIAPLLAEKTENALPKISIIPLSRLIREELLLELQAEQPNPTRVTPKKPICKPNLVKRQRKVSCGSNSSASATESMLDKVANMDKPSIQNVINSIDTKYDELLKLVTRKRLREEIRRQLKTINLNQDITSTIKEDNFEPDAIVNAIHIPDTMLKEIREVFGIEITGQNVADNTSELRAHSKSDIQAVQNPISGVELSPKQQHELTATTDLICNAVDGTEQPKPTTDLMRRLKTAEYIKSMNQKSNSKEGSAEKTTSISVSVGSNKSPDTQSASDGEIDTSKAMSSSPKESKKMNNSVEKSIENCKKRKEHKTSKVKVNKRSSDVIVIESSSSSSEDEDEQSSSSTSTSSSSDSDSNSSSHSSASIARRRLKRKMDAENVINSFEKLILPTLTDNLVTRYQCKYSNSMSNKLHFISCICTSKYNSKKFTKTEVAKIQRNLKSDNNSSGLEVLMREIVNVLVKQKHISRQGDNNRKIEAEPSTEKQKEDEFATNEVAAPNRISEPSQVVVMKGKNAEAAEKLTTKSRARKVARMKNNSPIPEGTRMEQQHQSANKEAVKCDVNESNTCSAESAKSASLAECNKEINNLAAKIYQESVGLGDIKISSSPEKEEEQKANRSCKLGLDIKPKLSDQSLNTTSYISYTEGCSAAMNTSSPLSHFPAFTLLNIDAYSQPSAVSDTCVSKLRQIDSKLLDLHKRQVFIEEMILKLQKDKMEVDLLAVRLQNEKFMLLNTAITANAAANTVVGTNVNSPATQKDLNQKETTTSVYNKSKTKRKAVDEKEAPKDPPRKKSIHSTKHLSKPMQEEWKSKRNGKAIKNAEDGKSAEPTTANSSPIFENRLSCSESTKLCQQASNANAETGNPKTYDILNGSINDISSPITQIRIFEKYIIAASENGYLFCISTETLQLKKQYVKHSEAITQMYLCEEKRVLYTASLDGYFKKTSVENFESDLQSLYLKEPLQSIDVQWGMAFIGSRWGNIFTYDVTTSHLSQSILCSYKASIIALKATEDGGRKVLIVCSKGNLIHFRNATNGQLLCALDVPEQLDIYSLLLHENTIYCGTQKKDIYKFDFLTGRLLSTLTCGNGAVSMKLYQSKYLFVGCYDGFIYVLDKNTGYQIGRFAGSGKVILALEIIGDKVMTSAKDKTLKIIDIPTNIIEKIHCYCLGSK